jgi:hypothetical protein
MFAAVLVLGAFAAACGATEEMGEMAETEGDDIPRTPEGHPDFNGNRGRGFPTPAQNRGRGPDGAVDLRHLRVRT